MQKPVRKLDEQIREYLDYCEFTRRMTPGTIYFKRNALTYFSNGVRANSIEELTNQDIDRWMAAQSKQGCSGRTVNNRLFTVRAMVRWFQGNGTMTPNLKVEMIIQQKEVPPRRVFYTREQVATALKYADRRENLMISLCFDCGLRLSELQNIRLADIKGRQITIVGKGAKKRFVFMSASTREKLDDWIYSKHITNWLWPSYYTGEPIDRAHLRKRLGGPFKAAGFTDFYPHALRHSFATDLQLNGASNAMIKVAMGHSSETITERYLHGLDGVDVEKIWREYKFLPTEK